MTRQVGRDPFGVHSKLQLGDSPVSIYRLAGLEETAVASISRLPYAVRVLLENVLRHCDGELVTEDDVLAVANWRANGLAQREFPFMPARVLLQDFTGVPAVADLAAMRTALASMGGDPERINPLIPVDLVIDHSVQVDAFGTSYAATANVRREFERNKERYTFLKWAQRAFRNLRVVPPGTGIVHQVNLEYLAEVVRLERRHGELTALPDTVVGTDSHTTMINGLSVLGWGVGGIEAEAVMLGQPYYMLLPEVIGVKLVGSLPEGATATDLVLAITQMLRRHGVVEKIVEFFGPGLSALGLADRAVIANMAPEYGATAGFFPVDAETIRFLRMTGRSEDLVQRVDTYCRAQGLFCTAEAPEPEYTHTVCLDMSTVEPSLAGPRRPQDRVALSRVKQAFARELAEFYHQDPAAERTNAQEIDHGSVVIAAITSCTNTSNPSLMLGAGLLAKKAVERGLQVKPYVKTSLAPGSRVVTDYLNAAGLLPYLEALRFHVVGYGCTTCIGNSGPLPADVAAQIQEQDLVAAAVLSGNRNFEGRVNSLVKANYLASPLLVVAYALAGRVDIDLTSEPLGVDPNGRPVYLKEIWPTQAETSAAVEQVQASMYAESYASVSEGVAEWRGLAAPDENLYAWEGMSTYLQEPPFFQGMLAQPPGAQDVSGARVLVVCGDSVTTDHISPAGAIAASSPAGQYLQERGVSATDFNSYGSRRGNHEVMMRGTFANIRLRNALVQREGGWTRHLPSNEEMPIFAAAERYCQEGVPLIILAGKEYGTGSSRDWAAKGPALLGVRAVLAESFERIHRSNLVGMGIVPLQFRSGESLATLGLTGEEVFDIMGLAGDLHPRQDAQVAARRTDDTEVRFSVVVRLDSSIEIEYLRQGGILQTVLRRMAAQEV